MKKRFLPTTVLAAVILNLLFVSGFQAAPIPAQAGPSIGGCQMFPDTNFWNVPITHLPVHPKSSAWVNSIGANDGFHMDFGSGTWNGGPIGIPYNVVSASVVNEYEFDFYYPDESDPGLYPLPPNPKIEHSSDHHLLVVETDECKLYEIYDASFDGTSWSGGSGAIWDLDLHTLRPDTWTSADAAGLPILPGLARYEEAATGVITHALRFTASCTPNFYIWPARHKAQHGSCTDPVPFGARFRLKADYDISGFSPQAQVLLQAFKTYGIVLADNGSDWYVSGSPSPSWNNIQLHELDVLRGSDFEAVDTSGLMVDPNSAETNHSDIPHVYSVRRADPNPTAATAFRFDVYFSEPVTGVDAFDFAAATGGDITGAVVDNVTGSGVAYLVTVSISGGYGTIQLNVLNDGTISDGVETLSSGFTNGEVYTRVESSVVTFTSDGTLDGWILESSETSGAGGTLNSTAATLNLGDAAGDKQYRAILHFDTSALPDNAIISSAVLKLRKKSVNGMDPFSVLGALRVDMRKPDFGTPALTLNDFKSAAGRKNVASFDAVPVGSWYSANLNNTGRIYINRTGTTQFRIYFVTDDNENNLADFIKFFSGNAGAPRRPKLVIHYFIP